jgi:hypothetical protein
MTERGLAPSDGALACPFVAFEDDRDERSDRPDHRHRCYAEVHPAPRAIAHQEAYCLSSAFAVCPTFQDWAQREAARARAAAGAIPPRQPGAPAETPEDGAAGSAAREAAEERTHGAPAAGEAAPGAAWTPATEWQGSRPIEPEEPLAPPPRRNPPRDWAAPPPWAGGMPVGGAGAAGAPATGGQAVPPSRPDGEAGAPGFLADRESRGLAGSAADRLAGGTPLDPHAPEPEPRSEHRLPPIRPPEPSQPADAELAGLVGTRARYDDRRDDDTSRHRTGTGRRPAVSSTRHPGEGPQWEEPRRYEAFPTIKTRASMPGLPRLGVMAAAIGIAALALFFLPAVLGWFGDDGGGGGGSATPSPSAPIVDASPSPTVVPAPTPQIYIVRSGDTMSKIANRFGVSVDALIEANKDTIKNPDLIAIGDRVIIPVPEPDSFEDAGAGASPAP